MKENKKKLKTKKKFLKISIKFTNVLSYYFPRKSLIKLFLYLLFSLSSKEKKN